MKIRKTRIKKTTKASGGIEYCPEYKGLFFWYSMYSWDSPSTVIWEIVCNWLKSRGEDSFSRSEQAAKSCIDFYIQQVNYKNACIIENEVIKTEYEDYP